jgi:hypothetical protein
VDDIPNASKRTSRTGERDDRLVASCFVAIMVLIAIEQSLEVPRPMEVGDGSM